MNIFDFGEIKENEDVIKSTWAEFRNALRIKKFLYDDVEASKCETFVRTYDDLFHDHSGIELQTKTLRDVKDSSFGRGGRLKLDENPTYARFIPQKKFINNDNRFSPAGIEWLYLAVGTPIEIVECAKAECRMKKGERFGFCQFELSDSALDEKMVDLSIADDITYDEINRELEEHGQKQFKKSMRIAKTMGVSAPIDKKAFKVAMTKWGVYTYSKLLSEQIFTPLEDNDDKAIEYAPFQAMAQYFITLGYAGIIYGSTVSPIGKNIVLFDKAMANPVGDIKIEDIS